MPKRTREDNMKPPPPVSAIAARRMKSQTTSAASTSTSVKTRRSAAQQLNDEATAHEEQVLERKLRNSARSKPNEASTPVKKAPLDQEMVDVVAEDPTPPPPSSRKRIGKGRHGSALSRVKRLQEERRRSTTDEDVEMRSVNGSEAEDNGNTELDNAEESSAQPLTQVSNFAVTDENCTATKDSVTFQLKSMETLILVGTYEIAVREGSIRIAGATLSSSCRPKVVFAPMTHALPVIEVPSRKRGSRTRSSQVKEEYAATIVVTNQHSGIVDIGKLCPNFVGIWATPSGQQIGPYEHSFKILLASIAKTPILSIPSSWEPTLSALNDAATSSDDTPRIAIAGAKGAGKSSFSRILTNMFLSSPMSAVAYLDVDPGQPEFSPPGVLSLHVIKSPILGPPFTHPNISSALRAHHVGYPSPREDPGHYLAAIADLCSHHRETLASVPLIINTCGWTKGLGLELLQDILSTSSATDIVFLGNGRQNPVSEILPPTVTLHELTVAAPGVQNPRFTAADLRNIQTMSYFHSLPGGGWDFSTSLTGYAPWFIPLTGPDRGIDGFSIMGDPQIPFELLATAVEGTIVGIVVIPLESEFPESEELLIDATALPPPSGCQCKGLAVVRALDIEKKEVQIITPLGEEEIMRWATEGSRIVLVRGRLELSVWEMMMPGGSHHEGMPWITEGTAVEGKGGAVWKVRRNVMRRAQQQQQAW